MKEYLKLTRYDLEHNLKAQEIISLQIISGAMVGGVLLLFLLSLFLFYNSSADSIELYSPANDGLINILSAVLIILAIVLYTIFYLLPQFQCAPERLLNKLGKSFRDEKGNEIKEPVSKIMFVFRGQMVIRLALLEVVALFGLILLCLSAINGSLHVRSIIWLTSTPAVIFLYFVFSNFSSKERIIENIDNNILKKLRAYNKV
jgi:hypothetical protein